MSPQVSSPDKHTQNGGHRDPKIQLFIVCTPQLPVQAAVFPISLSELILTDLI